MTLGIKHGKTAMVDKKKTTRYVQGNMERKRDTPELAPRDNSTNI